MKKQIPSIRETDTDMSLFSLQAKLLGMDIEEFNIKMKDLPDLYIKLLLQGISIHIPRILVVNPKFSTIQFKRLNNMNTSQDVCTSSRIVPRCTFKRHFKDAFRNASSTDRKDLF